MSSVPDGSAHWKEKTSSYKYYKNRKRKAPLNENPEREKYSVTWNCLHDFQLSILSKSLNPLHLHISMSILHTVLYTFPKVRTRRICLTIKSFFGCWSFPLFSWPWCLIQGNIVRRNRCQSLSKVKGLSYACSQKFITTKFVQIRLIKSTGINISIWATSHLPLP